ncbi:zeaxanthin glucosyltransferase [Hymenobacter sp. UYAg731]
MAHFGVLAPPLHGHLNPLLALATALTERGHAVTFFNIPDVEQKIRKAGHRIEVVGRVSYPLGWLPTLQAVTGRLNSLAAMLHWNEEGCYMAEQLYEEYAEAIAKTGVDYLLVDQIDILGGTLAEYLDIPFVSICDTLITNWEAGIPPSFVGNAYSSAPEALATNRVMFDAIQQGFEPVTRLINRVRATWGLPAFASADNYFPQSPLATISQQLRAFDFPRRALPTTFHYVGPMRLPEAGEGPFPYERLTGQPLVYASLGTLVNGNTHLFHAIAAACAPLDVQLVLAVGHGNDLAEFRQLPGAPLVVQYAPQQALLERATLAITHAGLNTVLDCLIHGVPMVAIPVSFDQPGIAARVQWTGVGEVVPLKRAGEEAIRRAVQALLADAGYGQRVRALQAQLAPEGGAARAATLLHDLVRSAASRLALARAQNLELAIN